ncbi:MAG: hypothetical protein ACLSB9_35430 [Hydrogeniiclostridium mannosilyticum]
MADENNQERSQAADAQVSSAAKTGKTISKLPWVQRLVAFMEPYSQLLKHQKMVGSYCWCPLLPVLLVVMLPSIIFGSLFGDGTDAPNGITDDVVMTQRMYDPNTGISTILSEGLSDVLARSMPTFLHPPVMEKKLITLMDRTSFSMPITSLLCTCASKDSDAQNRGGYGAF